MEQRGLQFSRIRAPRGSDPRALTAQSHRASHLVAHTEPPYPAEATAAGIEGKVALEIVVGRNGEILELSIRSGPPILAEAASQAVREWRYRPTTVNGVPVEVATDVEVTFTLPNTVVSD
jgi:protein TonB